MDIVQVNSATPTTALLLPYAYSHTWYELCSVDIAEQFLCLKRGKVYTKSAIRAPRLVPQRSPALWRKDICLREA